MAIFRVVVDLRVRSFQRAPKAGGVVSTLANAHAFCSVQHDVPMPCSTMCSRVHAHWPCHVCSISEA